MSSSNKAMKRAHSEHHDESIKEKKEMNSNNSAEDAFMKKINLVPRKCEDNDNQILFQKFLETCRKVSRTPEMEKILEKADSYYKKTKPDYVTSREFYCLLTSKIADITREPRSIYVYIKDVVDEMKARKLKLTVSISDEPPGKKRKISNGSFSDENSEKRKSGQEVKKEISDIAEQAELRYREKKIKKLSKALKMLHRHIEKLEQKEVDFDEDNDSAYVRLERYKERFCKVQEKLCELTGDSVGSKTCRRKIVFSGTDSVEVNRCIEKFVNSTGQFPDYYDILNLVKKVYSDESMKPEALRTIAQKAFVSVGRQLQKQRQYEDWDAVSVFLKDQTDPAESNPELESKLQESYNENNKRIQQVIDSFADKQIADKLEAEEVPDEEANKSEDTEQEEAEEEEEEEEEMEEEHDYVEKVLRGEDNLSSDDSKSAEEDNGASNEEDDTKSGLETIPAEEKQTDDIHSDSKVAANTDDDYSEPFILDVHRTGRFGPVSPPVLGEDLSKRGLYYVESPIHEDDSKSSEKISEEIQCSDFSDVKCKFPSDSDQHKPSTSKSSDSNQRNVHTFESASLSSDNEYKRHHSELKDDKSTIGEQDEEIKYSLSPSLLLEDDADFPQQSEHKNKSSYEPDIIEEDPSPSYKATTSLSVFSSKHAKFPHKNVTSPSVAVHSENLEVEVEPVLTAETPKFQKRRRLSMQTFREGKYIDNKFIVTKIELKSVTNPSVSKNREVQKGIDRPKNVRKFIRTMPICSTPKNIQKAAPDVITLE